MTSTAVPIEIYIEDAPALREHAAREAGWSDFHTKIHGKYLQVGFRYGTSPVGDVRSVPDFSGNIADALSWVRHYMISEERGRLWKKLDEVGIQCPWTISPDRHAQNLIYYGLLSKIIDDGSAKYAPTAWNT